MSFPAIVDLPPILIADSWDWKPFGLDSRARRSDFWLATSPDSTRWLVKLRGSQYAHREHSFARFAQHIGISCQSSTYLVLPPDVQEQIGVSETEPCQLAILLLDEHPPGSCTDTCPLQSLQEALEQDADDPVTIIERAGIRHLLDWPRTDILAHLCGANEPSQRLVTRDHSLVMIDNEQMFATGPGVFPRSLGLRPGGVTRSRATYFTE